MHVSRYGGDGPSFAFRRFGSPRFGGQVLD